MIVAKCPSGLRNCLLGSLIILAGVVVRTPASAAESWPALVNARYKLRRNSRTGVADRDHPECRAFDARDVLLADIASDCDVAPIGHRIARINGEVEDCQF